MCICQVTCQMFIMEIIFIYNLSFLNVGTGLSSARAHVALMLDDIIFLFSPPCLNFGLVDKSGDNSLTSSCI